MSGPRDINQIREALRGPGMDDRAWGQQARVEDDEDAVVWDDELGWLVSLVFVGGELDGDGPNVARLPSSGQGNGIGEHRPPRPGGLVCTTIPTGDPNDIVTIIGQLHTIDETSPARAPITINGNQIVERDAAEGQIAALETHMSIFPAEDLDQEWRNVRVCVGVDGAIRLAAPEADQPFPRGTDLADSLGDLADAISDIVTAINTGLQVAGSSIDPASLLTFEIAIETFKNAREQYLSQRIFGD